MGNQAKMSKTVRNPSFISILFLSILVSFVNSASIIVKRDVDEHTDLLGEAFSDKSRNFDDTCIKETTCLDIIQFCDRSKHIVYGTCTYHVWFWVVIAVSVVLGLASLLGCGCYWKLKK